MGGPLSGCLARTLTPSPTGAPGLGLLVLTQGGLAHHLLLLCLARQHGRQTLGQGNDTAHSPSQRGHQGAAVFPARLLNSPLSQNTRTKLVGHSTRSPESLLFLHCWGTRDEPQLFLEPQSSHL